MPVNNPDLKRQQCEAKHPNGYQYDKTNFNLGIRALNDFICDVHGLFKKTLRDFLRVEIPCEQCRVDKRKLGLKDGFDYSKTDFTKDVKSKNTFVCLKHGKFIRTLEQHKSFKCGGCSQCDSEQSSQRQRMSADSFVKLSKHKYIKEKYDYSQVHQFKNQHEPVNIICLKEGHGLFRKTPANHLHKTRPQACPLCGNDRGARKNSLTKAEFITAAKKIHGNIYDYSNINLKNTKSKINLRCKKCNNHFEQVAGYHLSGNGCSVCGAEKSIRANKTLTTESVIKKCIEVWGDKYDYSNVSYLDDNTPIEVICRKHGSIMIDYQNHVCLKRGCKFCGSTRRVKQSEWLSYLGIPESDGSREVTIKCSDGKIYYADGYDPDTNTIYEFNGDYFHGNPEKYEPTIINAFTKKTMEQLYKETINKKEKLIKNGYRVIDIWESEWDDLKKHLAKSN